MMLTRCVLVSLLIQFPATACQATSPAQQSAKGEAKAAADGAESLLDKAEADEGWKQVGSQLETTRDKAALTFPTLKLPDTFLLSLEVGSLPSQPHFTLALADGDLQIETWDDTLVLLLKEEFVELQRLKRADREVSLMLGFDRSRKTATVFSAAGKVLGQVKGDVDPGTLTLRNEGPYLNVRSLDIEKWDGTTKPGPRSGFGTRRLIYTGPNKGRGWQTEARNGELSYWSTNSAGGLVCNAPHSPAFLPVKDLPENFELELAIQSSRELRVRRWKVALSEPDDASDKSGLWAARTWSNTLDLAVTRGVGKQQLTAGTDIDRASADCPEAESGTLRLRLFYKKLDDRDTLVTIRAANGREITKARIRSAQRRQGIVLWAQAGMTFSEVNIRKWDGKPLRSLATARLRHFTKSAKLNEHWKRNGTAFETTKKRAVLTFDSELPERCSIEVELDAGSKVPAFLMSLGDDGPDFEIWDNSLVMLQGEQFREIRTVHAGGLRIRVFIDPAKGVAVYGDNGDLAATLKLTGKPSRLTFTNRGAELTVKDLVVREWDGVKPGARSSALKR